MKTNKNVFGAALKLPLDDRLALVKKLIESVNNEQADIDAAWAEEIQRRVEAYERGEIDVIPMDEVFQSIRRERKA